MSIGGGPPNVGFTLTRTRVNSDSCVNDGYCLRHFGVDTVPSTYFSPVPSRTLPLSTRTMTDSGQLRSSISLPGYHVDFFTFAEHVSFEHSTTSPLLMPVFWRSPASARSGAGAATFLATESTGTVLTTSQMSEIAGHGNFVH